MKPLTRGQMALLTAPVFGLLGERFLSTGPWGLDFTVFVAALAGAAAILAPAGRISPALLFPLLFFAGAVAVRDDPMLRGWNIMAVGLLGVLAAMQHRGAVLARMSDRALLHGTLATAVTSALGTGRLATTEFADARSALLRATPRAAVGVLLAFPLIFVFAPLLDAADPRFGEMWATVLPSELGDMIRPLWWIVFFGGLVAGFLSEFVREHPLATPESRGHLGALEIAIPLGMLALLFASYNALQVEYLFGGAAAVAATPGLTFAGYARSGFFELTAAAGLTVPVLLLGHGWLREGAGAWTTYRLLSATIIGLVAVLMVSALHRMSLYWTVYGPSLDRLYATAFMLWLGFVLAWLGVTTLRGAHTRFTFGAVAAGLVVLGGLNAINPARVVAESMLARTERQEGIDCDYLVLLGADAVPTLVRALRRGTVPPECALASRLVARYRSDATGSWNLARYRVGRSLAMVPRERLLDEQRQD